MVFHKDPLGIIVFFSVHLLLLYGDIVVVYYVIEYGGEHEGSGRTIMALFVHLFYIMAAFSHLREEKPFELQLSEWTVCTKCESYRPPCAHHCKHCNRCVRRMDHHCHWINNCVGIHNYKFFFLFVCYSEVLVIGAGLSLIWDWRRHKEIPDDTLDRVLTFGLFIIDALFTFFVNGMLVSQILAVLCNRTFVEVKRYGRPVGKPKESRMSLITAVCGRGPMWLWCLPFTKARIPDPVPPSDIALNQFVD